jgi:hypothetical protein
MKTLAQSWRERLAELRALCRANGERLPADLRVAFDMQHAGQWWAAFCEAALRGDEIPATVWSSAEKLGAKRMPGYVPWLRGRNRAARDHLRGHDAQGLLRGSQNDTRPCGGDC